RVHIFEQDSSPIWRTVLERSMLEPGLSRILRDPQTPALHAGGWVDLQPVQVLQAAGCEDVVYVTRQGEETSFITLPRPITQEATRGGVAELLGLEAKDQDDLYALSNYQSSYSRAVSGSSLVWCTDWNRAK